MVGIFGIDNVGKTTFHHFLAVAYSKRHGVNWLFICNENAAKIVRQKLIELYCGKPLHLCTTKEYNEGFDFCYKYFDLASGDLDLTTDNFIKSLNAQFVKKTYDFVFIDPYNSIQFEQSPTKNYAFLGSLRSFQKKWDCGFHISMHIATDKARNFVYSDKEYLTDFEGRELGVKGHMKVPRKNFVEGGQPVANKLDDIIIVHRLPKMIELRTYALISIDKVKEDKTGGMQSFDDPIMFKKSFPYDSFTDRDGVNPINPVKKNIEYNANAHIEPNTDFNQEQKQAEDLLPF